MTPMIHDTPPVRRRWLLASALTPLLLARPGVLRAQSPAFDHRHAAWTALLKKHVVLIDGGAASQVRYAGLATDRAALKAYTEALSAVTPAAFAAFTKAQQMVFLINAYNAFTVALILTRYPKLASIRDLGTLLSNPWKPKFIALLGTQMSLDDIEHGTLRARGRYEDPRIHFAVNCASIGCPMLREEAFVAERLDAQLDEQARRFMADRSRNRFNAPAGRLELSRIFDWYGDDFRQGHRGIGALHQFVAAHAEQLADGAAERERLRTQTPPITFLDYDWKLNDVR